MRRHLAPLLIALIVAAACGGAVDDATGADGATTSAPTAADGGVDTGASDGLSGGQPGASTTLDSSSPNGGGNAGAGAGAPIPAQEVGRLAPYLLQAGHGNRIVVEVRSQAGAEPRQATIEHLLRLLRDASGKTVTEHVAAVGGSARDWTSRSLRDLADSSSATSQGGEQVVVRLLFLHGTFEGDGGVLGVAVRGDVAAVFSDRIDAAAGILVDPAQLEVAAAAHELGHLLGLVDLVLSTGRSDPDHPGHSPNTGSVMYWAVESDAITQLLGGRVPKEFDGDDRADLAAIRRG